ncbi:hypothetical protein [Streptomyces sp. NPDC001880]
MGLFHTNTEISRGHFSRATGTHLATVKAETKQEAADMIEHHLQEQGWETGRTTVQPGR